MWLACTLNLQGSDLHAIQTNSYVPFKGTILQGASCIYHSTNSIQIWSTNEEKRRNIIRQGFIKSIGQVLWPDGFLEIHEFSQMSWSVRTEDRSICLKELLLPNHPTDNSMLSSQLSRLVGFLGRKSVYSSPERVVLKPLGQWLSDKAEQKLKLLRELLEIVSSCLLCLQ